MSFYGSRYYQATDAFAKILIKNSGLNKTEFLTGNLPDRVEIEADGRTSELKIDSGNRWIKLKGSDNQNEVSLYHNDPDQNSNLFINIINPKSVKENEDGETIINEDDTVLDVSNGVRFSVPIIHYDAAGHVFIPNNELMQTFVMPKIATAKEIDALKERMTSIEKQMLTVHETLEEVSDIADEAKVKADYTYTEFDSFRNTANEWKGQLDNLDTQVEALQKLTTNLTNDIYDLKAKIDNL